MFLKPLAKLVAIILLCLATGFLGSLFTRQSIPNWYADLQKPSFNPPDWIFAPVWTILYLMMAVSAFIILSKDLHNPKVKIALIAFLIQLLLNGLWTPIFFGAHLIFVALIEIIILWLSIILTIVLFWKISIPASLLLLPYILWVTFAAVLNAAIWLLNR
jgi:tryptophan-rich sensory protein